MKALLTLISVLFVAQTSFALDCHGTEPFWGATIDHTALTLEMAGDAPTTQPVTRVESAWGYSSDFLLTYSDNRGPVAVVKSNLCNNGMSDDEFGKEIMIFTNTGVLYGCCGPAL